MEPTSKERGRKGREEREREIRKENGKEGRGGSMPPRSADPGYGPVGHFFRYTLRQTRVIVHLKGCKSLVTGVTPYRCKSTPLL